MLTLVAAQSIHGLFASFGLCHATTHVNTTDALADRSAMTSAITVATRANGIRAIDLMVGALADEGYDYENASSIRVPNAVFDLPADVDLRFKRFIDTYHLTAVGRSRKIEKKQDPQGLANGSVGSDGTSATASAGAGAVSIGGNARSAGQVLPGWILTASVCGEF